MHIGLYFGSFNPIHVGHLIIASYARHTTHLKQVWLIVSPQNPLKESSSLLNEYNRLHLVRLAIGDNTDLRVSNIEFKLPKPSYTINTLTYLEEKYPQHSFSIIMGSDSFENLPKWFNFEQLIKRYSFCVFMRPGHPIVNDYGATFTVIDAPLLDISSTQIRQYIKQKIPIRYMVPDAAAEEIEINNYYK